MPDAPERPFSPSSQRVDASADATAAAVAAKAASRSAAEVAGEVAGEVAEAARLAENAVDCLPEGGLAEKLRLAREQGRQLRVKLGIDPTAPDIHLGHAVVLRKLRDFQDAGHRVVLIVGDYTARVGDPSGRSTLRPMLSAEEIEANAATFQEQALKVLDPSPELLEVRCNGEWLDMPMEELLRLVRTTTVAQLLEREDFARRFSESQPISMLELMYPLLQGYDSVAVRADVELGGTDQKFNLLLGRDIQRAYGVGEQAILTMPILVGVDGRQKMSKSLGNHIGITDPPQEMYGKTMSIPDEAMGDYYRLLLERPPDPVLSPRDAKRALARGIVQWLHGADDRADAGADDRADAGADDGADAGANAALEAERHFDRIHVERSSPERIEEAVFDSEDGTAHLPAVISSAFGLSRSEARRLIDQGAVSLDEEGVAPGEHDIPVERLDGVVLRVGKRRFRRLRAG